MDVTMTALALGKAQGARCYADGVSRWMLLGRYFRNVKHAASDVRPMGFSMDGTRRVLALGISRGVGFWGDSFLDVTRVVALCVA